MRDPSLNGVVELFGVAAQKRRVDWRRVVEEQRCPFLEKKCYKVRKSDPGTSIGTCTLLYGRPPEPVVICPTRLTERRRIFADALPLLTLHKPGNDLHIIPEVSIPGGSVDYFLVSSRSGYVQDFVGIEIQTLDTTGTVWPERQRLLRALGVVRRSAGEESTSSYGMNWKMTAKTILVQMHHKALTFEHVHKKLVLIVQDRLLAYMRREFQFDHVHEPATAGDSVHLHTYRLKGVADGSRMELALNSRLSTDADGMARCLGLQAEARIELNMLVETLRAKLPSAIRLILR